MTESLFSDQWYRVSDTHPRLRPEVEVQRQTVRDQRWYLLVNTANGRQFRINEKAYELVGRLDGGRSVKQAWEALLCELRDDAPTQDEVIQTLSELDRQELLAHDIESDARAMVRRRDERQQQKAQRFVNPLALRVPLGAATDTQAQANWDLFEQWLRQWQREPCVEFAERRWPTL